jgi:hypothetical protein
MYKGGGKGKKIHQIKNTEAGWNNPTKTLNVQPIQCRKSLNITNNRPNE